jgi:hypothetical protein
MIKERKMKVQRLEKGEEEEEMIMIKTKREEEGD